MSNKETQSPGAICFGLDLETDRRSFELFIRCLASPDLLTRLAARLESGEISLLVDQITRLLKRHLSHNEYHRHFLGDE